MIKLFILFYHFFLKISSYLEKFSSTIVFLMIYFFVLLPVGVVMKLFGYNAMRSNLQNNSFFLERNKEFTPEDFINPF